MRKRIKRFVAIAAMLCLILAFIPVGADAVSDAQAQRYNIMLVIDGSGSLTYEAGSKMNNPGSDSEGFRFDAVESFLDTLQSDGHYVGAMVFTGATSTVSSDEAMREGAIKYDSWENGPVAFTESEKIAIKSALREHSADYYQGMHGITGETDIGTALLVAAEHCVEAQNQNGLPSAIFLFTDGAFVCVNQSKAEKNYEQALQMIRENDIKLCGVMLNTLGTVADTDIDEFKLGIKTANGFTNNDLGAYYTEINQAEDIQSAIDNFLKLLGYPSGKGEFFKGTTTFTFRIPGFGVEEVNIRIRTKDFSSFPDGTDVTILKPDGTYSNIIPDSNERDSYRIYKMTGSDLISGVWTVTVTLPEDNDIWIEYEPIFSLNAKCAFDTSVAVSDIHSNMTVQVTPYLYLDSSSGISRQTDPAAYNEFSCTFTLTDTVSGETRTYDVTKDPTTHLFTLDLPVDFYGSYYASVVFTCDELSASYESNEVWDIINHEPTAYDISENIRVGLFADREVSFDVTAYDDIEDGAGVAFKLTGFNGCSSDAFDCTDNTVTVHTKGLSDGCVEFTVTDTQGESATGKITITTYSYTMQIVIAFVIAILIILFIIWFVITHQAVPDGECSLSVEIPEGDGGFGHAVKTLDISLTPPGKMSKRKTTLGTLIQKDLSRPNGSIMMGCPGANLSAETARSFFESRYSELKKVHLKCVGGKGLVDGKRKKVAKILMKYNGKSSKLYGSSMTVTIGGAEMIVSYYPRNQAPVFDANGAEPVFGGNEPDPWGGAQAEEQVGFGAPAAGGNEGFGAQNNGWGGSSSFGEDIGSSGFSGSGPARSVQDTGSSGFGFSDDSDSNFNI